MDHKEELCNNNDVNDGAHHIIHKGKRTKRMRLLSTNTTVVMSSCSSASGSDGGGGEDQGSSTMTTDQEEEDMANCLILLAQGGGGGGGGDGDGGSGDSDYHEHHQQQKQQVDQDHGDDGDDHKIEIKGRKISEIVTATTTNKVGFYIYECKTCNRTFPSFQALGGHRASHKRPKIMTDEKKLPPPPVLPPATSPPQVMDINYDPNQFELGGVGGQLLQPPHIKSVAPINPISLQFGSAQKAISFNGNNNNNKSKIHECSICGSEFSSGQALGGHMRRHRASTNTGSHAMNSIHTISTTAVLEVQPRTVLGLDLNLPAPEEELREPPKLQFTAPALVDCHY